jgi:hypothetical protein
MDPIQNGRAAQAAGRNLAHHAGHFHPLRDLGIDRRGATSKPVVQSNRE